jgi:hypothetical protein
MSYQKRLAISVTLGICIPITLISMIKFTQPLSVSDLPAAERNAIGTIEKLNINVSCGDFGCDFRPRGRIALSNDTDDGQCHVTEFELLPSPVVPVGGKHNVSEETHRKLVGTLIQLRYLQRIVLPDVSKSNLSRLRRQLSDCALFSQLSDVRPYSAKVVLTSSTNGQ